MSRDKAKQKEYNKRYYKANREKWLTYQKSYYLANKDYYDKARYSLKGRFQILKGNCKRRNIPLELSFEEFCYFAEKLCFYCNAELGISLTGAGLDRVNNDLGYTKENVVPCCGFCNAVKSDLLTQEETQAAIKAIIKVRYESLQSNQGRKT